MLPISEMKKIIEGLGAKNGTTLLSDAKTTSGFESDCNYAALALKAIHTAATANNFADFLTEICKNINGTQPESSDAYGTEFADYALNLLGEVFTNCYREKQRRIIGVAVSNAKPGEDVHVLINMGKN
jgi:hypothetical protein